MGEIQFDAKAPSSIRELFSKIASRYDLTNAVLSFGLHHVWNRRLAQSVLMRAPTRLVDLCCGTGEIAKTFLRYSHLPSVQITCVDFCPSMLALATHKLAPWSTRGHQLVYLVADVQSLPLPEGQFDAATIAYGIRNVAEPLLALREAFRVLRPGGQLAILELTRPTTKIMRGLHRLYTRWMLPLLGRLTTSSADAYRYLGNSIQEFLEPQLLARSMQEAGFEHIEVCPLWGGTATLFIGYRR